MYKLVVLFAAVSAVCAATDYCTISAQNTLCLYKSGILGSACVQPLIFNITATDKANILAAHNAFRRSVAKGLETKGNPGPQPAASNMRELTWDDELATMAQTWANQCTYQHDANRNVPRFYVGQNLYTSYSSQLVKIANWTAAVNSWYSEVANMDNTYVASFPQYPSKGVIGHYTQVVWAETSVVGCGIVGFYNSAKPSYPNQILYACNYGSGGNYISTPVYKAGAAATACPTGTVANNGLCSIATSG